MVSTILGWIFVVLGILAFLAGLVIYIRSAFTAPQAKRAHTYQSVDLGALADLIESLSKLLETFSNLIHEQEGGGIMVTHDLRMTKYVDKVIQMVDGKVRRMLEDRAQIDSLASISSFAAAQASSHEFDSQLVIPELAQPIPAYALIGQAQLV